MQTGCFIFFSRSSGYRALRSDDYYSVEESAVKVIVGKDRREFLVEPFILEAAPFRVLVEMASYRPEGKHKRRRGCGDDRVVFIDVDAILFEHMLWLVYNDCSSSIQFNLKEIIEFYSQDW